MVNPFLTLRHEDEDETKIRLHEANLSFDHGENVTVLYPKDFRQFMAAVIHQTHERPWLPIRPMGYSRAHDF